MRVWLEGFEQCGLGTSRGYLGVSDRMLLQLYVESSSALRMHCLIRFDIVYTAYAISRRAACSGS